MHTLFAIEDLYGLYADEIDGELCLRLDKTKGTTYLSMFDMIHAWQEQTAKLKAGEITKEEYNRWRYTYPNREKEKFRENLNTLRTKKNAENQENND